MKTLLIAAALAASVAVSAHAQTLQSETPAHFKDVTSSFDFDRRDVMIPMRDGVHLHTVILVPRGAHRAPMLLTRTPYNATELTSYDDGAHLVAALDGYDNADDVIVAAGYIRVVQVAAWPQGCEANCPIGAVPMYLLPGAKLSPDAGTGAADAASSYVSDPARPVPFIQRPIHLLEEGEARSWTDWLSSDQREAATRPDVLTFTTDRLTAPMKIAGAPVAHLDASITGTDVDFVVKVIDVYPDQVAQQHELGGYQLMVSADILRGRFRHAYDKPEAVPANQKQSYVFPLPNANHVFLPGHRIMVQVQSTWFPLYDRNPQTYVNNIFFAKTADYQPETIKLFADSVVDLPVVKQ